jgi:hypothetical protein
MIHNNRLEIKTRCGNPPLLFVFLLGLPSFCCGILFIVIGLTRSLPFPVILGLVFAIVGGGVMFGCSEKLIDGDNRQVTSWWGLRAGWLLVPFKKSVYSFDDFQSVTVCEKVRKSSDSSDTCYPVRIESAGDSVTVEEPRDYHKSRQRAEEVAKLMGLPMQDSTSGEVVVREAEQLDDSLRDQFQRTGERLDVPVQPDGCRVSYRLEGDALVLDLPSPVTGPILKMWGCLLFVVIAAVVLMMWNLLSGPPPMNYIAVCFILILLGGGLKKFLREQKGRTALLSRGGAS